MMVVAATGSNIGHKGMSLTDWLKYNFIENMLLIESNYIETVGTEIFMQNDEPRMKWPSEDPNFGNPMGYIYGGKCTADDDCAMSLSYCEESVEGDKNIF